jgi:signal peptidase I
MIDLHSLSHGTWRMITLAAAATALVAQPYRALVVNGVSMEPALTSGQVVLTLPAKEIHRGDVVVVRTELGALVKRVAYLEGDRIPAQAIGNRWNPAVHAWMGARDVVPAGHAFVLGDNFGNSWDSRSFGPVPLTSISRVVVWPTKG